MPRPLHGGRRSGTGRKQKPANQKLTSASLYLPTEDFEAFKLLVSTPSDRNKLLLEWVRAYCISKGESDRLLAQSPVALKIINYLNEREDAIADELAEELHSLLVQRDSDAIALEDKAIVVGDSIIL